MKKLMEIVWLLNRVADPLEPARWMVPDDHRDGRDIYKFIFLNQEDECNNQEDGSNDT